MSPQNGNDQDVLVAGFGVGGYRSFFGETQRLGRLSKVSIIAGHNNSGKSNVLRFAQNVLGRLQLERRGGTAPALSGFDLPIGPPRHDRSVSLAVTREAVETSLGAVLRYDPRLVSLLTRLPVLQDPHDDAILWFDLEGLAAGTEVAPAASLVNTAIQQWDEMAAHHRSSWQEVHAGILNAFGGGTVNQESIMSTLLYAAIREFRIPEVETVDATRRVEHLAAGDEERTYRSGKGLIHDLAALQSPEPERWIVDDRKWAAINRFLQTVLEDDSARLHVPNSKKTIVVELGGRRLPLENLGTGIQQVVILAAAATLLTGKLVCIEEPEVHLHPVLQKKLVAYLIGETSHQYLLTTHSAHLLDAERAGVFHVALTPSGSTLTGARGPHELLDICHDLGYRPSDLLQTNCVIWVEGPSDRLYLLAWLKIADEGLVEGIHFSIMFYGGSLLSHLSGADERVDDFINLRRLNQWSMIVIDSDRRSPGERINATKRRVRDEFKQRPHGFVWITAGYTIENYVRRNRLATATSAVHPGRTPQYVDDRWDNPFPASGSTFDKAAVARELARTAQPDDLEVAAFPGSDLRTRIAATIRFIRDANDAHEPA